MTLPKINAINKSGRANKNIPTINSTNNMQKIISNETEIRTDFIAMPNKIEKITNPSLYSFFRGLKNVLVRSDRDRREATYRLQSIKKL